MANSKISIADDREKIGPLVGAVFLVGAPHVQNLAPSVMAYFVLLCLWRAAGLYFKVNLPRGIWLFLLALAGTGIVLGQYHRFWGQEAGSSLLIIGLGLKLMELKTRRDAYLSVFLAFFVALTQYLFSQSISMAGYTLAVVVLLVGVMIGFNSNEAFPAGARLKMAGLMVAQALPAMVLLFLFFPRIPGPLWQLPDENHGAKTGLSDILSPGSVSRLALSRETAFRVDFDGEPPPRNLLYWRGQVFWLNHGANWSLSPTIPLSPRNKPRFGGNTYTYTVTLEPHNQRWIFALDLPDSSPGEFSETTDYQLLAREAISENKQYRLSSDTLYHTGPLSERETKMGLQLPGKPSTRLEQLVKGWREENPTPNQLVARALRHFREENFHYTLNPPLTEGDPVDSFLFDTRRGFCEHYATAFVVLMRLGQVPARVVTGYQGGQWNRLGRFLEIKQADAHAWAEVWLEESGWTRVDPTAAVAPERIERGLDIDTQINLREIHFNFGEIGASGQGFYFAELRLWTRMIASSIDHAWDSWVLGYGPENQGSFLKWLGLDDWGAPAGWLSALVILCVGVMAWLIRPKSRVNTDPPNRLYERFLRKMAKRGLVRKTGEGALSFCERIASVAPELAESAGHITHLYLRLRYERTHFPDDMEKLRRLVRAFPRKPSARRDGAKSRDAHLS